MKFVASLLAVIIVFGLFSACNNSIGSPADGGQSSENQQLHIVDKKGRLSKYFLRHEQD